MRRIQLSIEPAGDAGGVPLRFEVLDEATALLVADINVSDRAGNAELWDGDRRLARLTKYGGNHATFWEVSR